MSPLVQTARISHRAWSRLGALLPGSGLREVLGGAALVFVIRVAGAALAYVGIVLLARWMGAFELGVYVYVASWALLLGLLLPLGLNQAVLRFVPEYRVRGFTGRMAGFVMRARMVVAGSAVIAAGTGALVVMVVRDVIPDYYVQPLLIGLAAVPVLALINLYQGLGRALGRVGIAFAPSYVVQPVFLIGGLALAISAGAAVTATLALSFLLVAMLAVLAIVSVSLGRSLRRETRDAEPRFHTRYWLAISMPLLFVEAFFVLLEHTDILVLGAMVRPEDVSAYYAALRTAGMLGFLQFAVVAIAGPRIAAIHAAGSRADLQRFVDAAVHLGFWPSLLAAAVLAVAGPFLLSLFDESFRAAYPALLVLALGFLVRAATGPVEYLLNMTGHQMAAARIYGCVAVANVVGNVLLIPLLGYFGAALSTAIATAAVNLWMVVEVRRRLGVTACIVPLGPTSEAMTAGKRRAR